jgi:ATP synthase subunit 6
MFNNIINLIYIKKIFFDPLEQFDIFNLITSIGLTNFVIFISVLCFIILKIYKIRTQEHTIIKLNNFSITFRNFLFNFLENITNANIILSKQFLIILYLFVFIFILGSNILGLIPYSLTITSSFIVTFSLSLIYFLTINILAIYHKGFFPFLSMFFPSGSPKQIAPLLVLIEIVSYIARVFSLSIRLFANMMAGHTLLKILIGFSFSMLLSNSFLLSFSILPWIIVALLIILEILISLLQSYVFLILICIYVNDIIITH